MYKKIIILLTLIISTSCFALDGNIPWTAQNFRATDGKMYFGVTFDVPEGLSLYWKNPGDSGSAPKVEFFSNAQKLEIEDGPWPVPHRKIVTKELWTYNIDGKTTLFYEVPGKVQDQIYDKDVTIEASWLVCADVCVPGSGTISGHYIHDTYTAYRSPTFSLSIEELEKKLSAGPLKKELPMDFEFQLGKISEQQHILFYSTSIPYTEKFKSTNLLFPFPSDELTFGHESLMHDKAGNLYGSILIEGEITLPLRLNFLANHEENGTESEVTIKDLSPSIVTSVNEYKKMFTPIEVNYSLKVEDVDTSMPEESSVWMFLLFAFIGGLILNVMPCVLPVISIKLFGLIKINGSSHKEILIHNLLYTGGILLSFAILGAVVMFFKAAGESVGWGFQMQSPRFLLFMIIALLIFALNMFGLFEFRTPGGSFLGNVSVSNHHLGSFLSGVLATVLSTPCSAPFLGTALTFAFTASNALLFSTLMMIGFGLAFPILLTGIFPKIISFFPRPGNWMNHLKKFLGLSLAATVIWLVSVFYTLTSTEVLPGPFYNIMIIMALILLSFITYRFKKYISWFFAIGAMTMTFLTYNMESVEYPNIKTLEPIAGSEWINWSSNELDKYIGKQAIFVKFTADWCITCKVDTKLIIKSEGFSQLVKKHNLALMVADYTSPNPEMDKWMKKHKIVGVPAYLIQFKDGTRKRLEGQLTLKKLDDLLKD